ncbi:MAG: hypothetical protein KF726_22995 [Anaerolineae bacterium]|nr:hypothetical protein [Anaerolineae bacterium]
MPNITIEWSNVINFLIFLATAGTIWFSRRERKAIQRGIVYEKQIEILLELSKHVNKIDLEVNSFCFRTANVSPEDMGKLSTDWRHEIGDTLSTFHTFLTDVSILLPTEFVDLVEALRNVLVQIFVGEYKNPGTAKDHKADLDKASLALKNAIREYANVAGFYKEIRAIIGAKDPDSEISDVVKIVGFVL